jgi:hypothetical protein
MHWREFVATRVLGDWSKKGSVYTISLSGIDPIPDDELEDFQTALSRRRGIVMVHDVSASKWTRKLPTKPGWYWTSYRRLSSPQCVNVYFARDGELYTDVLLDEKRETICDFVRDSDCPVWWIGPLAVPEAPQ